ncbi:hypothetical protein G7B40_040470 [Aetokthonos hydrillicola Thurmond2011]|jgi:hypothetical protein|uniref:Uncharacterized protein n=2 Tax=Aetokthonos TaxID=1550243 RepID=A0AAP5IG75_9CYAN|nr:hypothetical protein [Aetokthonos hydrillicola]MDR9900764.1 hypothetical protein [Aetokthonos hydrillicola Thurmond2011]
MIGVGTLCGFSPESVKFLHRVTPAQLQFLEDLSHKERILFALCGSTIFYLMRNNKLLKKTNDDEQPDIDDVPF